jgi:hypothetical protein
MSLLENVAEKFCTSLQENQLHVDKVYTTWCTRPGYDDTVKSLSLAGYAGIDFSLARRGSKS